LSGVLHIVALDNTILEYVRGKNNCLDNIFSKNNPGGVPVDLRVLRRNLSSAATMAEGFSCVCGKSVS
jgi:hypothetical protein